MDKPIGPASLPRVAPLIALSQSLAVIAEGQGVCLWPLLSWQVRKADRCSRVSSAQRGTTRGGPQTPPLFHSIRGNAGSLNGGESFHVCMRSQHWVSRLERA